MRSRRVPTATVEREAGRARALGEFAELGQTSDRRVLTAAGTAGRDREALSGCSTSPTNSLQGAPL